LSMWALPRRRSASLTLPSTEEKSIYWPKEMLFREISHGSLI
jgi:hypothetical protein